MKMKNNDFPEAYKRFLDLVASRYSCRDYAPEPVDSSLIEAVVEAARLAPSAVNRQPWTFVAVTEDGDLRDAVLSAYNRNWIASAPAFIIAIGNHTEAWHRPSDGKDHTDVDLSIAIQHICLAAASLGMQTCWVCNFDAPLIASALSLPSGMEPIALIPIGFPATESPVPDKKRKSLNDILRWEKV